MAKYIRNIYKTFDRASDVDIETGLWCYYRYHEVMVNVAKHFDLPVDRVIACFAALSPNMDYLGNLRGLISVCRGYVEGVDVNDIRTEGYAHCKIRAYSYLSGEVDFESTVKGKKILAFYNNIYRPLCDRYVTIDGHMANLARGQKLSLHTARLSNTEYDYIAEAFKAIARKHGLMPHQLQGILWFTWKRVNNIRYIPPQLHLFEDRTQDLWRIVLSVKDYL